MGFRAGRLLLLAALLAATAACAAAAPEGVVSLAGPWAFHPGDDPRWADPAFDDHGWVRLQVPRSWGRQGFADVFGVAWYRIRVSPSAVAGGAIGVTIGKVDSAYDIFAGGQRLGGVGKTPPAPRMEYDRHGTYSIPASARDGDGSVLIALRVWRADGLSPGAAGPVEGPFEVGPIARLVERAQLVEAAQLALVIVFLLTAAYHIVLGVLHPGTDEYEWFGVFVIEAACYAFLRTQWKYAWLDDFVALKKAEHLLLYLVPATMLQFAYVYFHQPRPRWAAALQATLVVLGVFVVASPGLGLGLWMLPVLYGAALVISAAGVGLVASRLRVGDPDAPLVGVGLIVLVVTFVNDAIVERNLWVAPRLSVYGFAALVFVMGLSLVIRFRRAVTDLDQLRRGLEDRVEARTAELSEAYRRMEELALRDGLTRLLNRRALQERALAGLSLARRKGAPFAVAMVDIDHFKAVNDTHGHAAGDQVLAHLAERLTAGVRASDDVGRWGGEEFLILLPDSDRDAALVAAERLRASVESAPIRIEGNVQLGVTVSLGVAVIDEPAASVLVLEGLIRLADDALYRAKAAGRNRVVVA